MKRALWVTLSRNDSLPANKILAVLDAIKAHGFDMDAEPKYHGGELGLISASVVSTNFPEALRKLAAALGQDNPALDGVSGTGKLIHVGILELIHLDEGIMVALSGYGLVRGIYANQDTAQARQEPSRNCL